MLVSVIPPPAQKLTPALAGCGTSFCWMGSRRDRSGHRGSAAIATLGPETQAPRRQKPHCLGYFPISFSPLLLFFLLLSTLCTPIQPEGRRASVSPPKNLPCPQALCWWMQSVQQAGTGESQSWTGESQSLTGATGHRCPRLLTLLLVFTSRCAPFVRGKRGGR